MKKYSKSKMKFKRFGYILAILFIIVLVCSVSFLFTYCLKDTKEISPEINSAINVSDEIAQNSQPIVIDNLVVGGLYGNTWVSTSKYYLKSKNKTDLDTYVYTNSTRAGEYKIKDTYTYGDSVFVNTSYPNYVDQYFAIPVDTYSLTSQFAKADVIEKDYDYVKKALGLNRIYNSTMNIKNVYTGFVDVNTPVRIILVTSESKGNFGGIYNAAIVASVNDNKTNILQYYYTKDLENTYDFPLYSVEFLADLNGDGVSELVTREVTEFNVTYNVFEYKNGMYKKVLTETMKGK